MVLQDHSSFPTDFDVLVIGSGAAGLYTALCLPSHLKVGLVTKGQISMGSSNWAQGGIAAAIDPSDSPRFHLTDTLTAGAGLCDPEAVAFLVDHASESIASLVDMGVGFDRHDNQLAMTLEAAHSHARVLHSADTTGRAIVKALIQQVLERSNVHILSDSLALSLWLHPETSGCQGISLLANNKVEWIRSGAVVLATGGAGQVFSQTTNPTVCTGDGVAMAWRAGAILRDLEFYQFHPTALAIPGAPRFLISEAVRGEGAHLVDDQGDRFAFNYHPNGELAPRDVVSRAIFSHLQQKNSQNGHDSIAAHVYLDLSPIDPDRIRYRFPNIIQVCKEWGIDVFKQPIPVAPAAHYWMGGIAVDVMGQTSIPNLYAVGETTSTGVHGANRLASNSLLECIVFAAQLSHIQLQSEANDRPSSHPQVVVPSNQWEQEMDQVKEIRKTLPLLLWEKAGVYREQLGLDDASGQIKAWQNQLKNLDISRYILHLSPNQQLTIEHPHVEKDIRFVAETLNLLDTAALILLGASSRTESRGGHHRVDYPDSADQWQVHTMMQGDNLWTAAIAESGKV